MAVQPIAKVTIPPLFWVGAAGVAILAMVLWKYPAGRTIAILLLATIVLVWVLKFSGIVMSQVKGL